ncbi:MAG: hypothetical protein JXJ04_14025 [Spirochaetales bacterium]|nr:hypothetical protein [Spirochaetales bacterium]
MASSKIIDYKSKELMARLHRELKYPEEYFPYIGHDINHDDVFNNKVYKKVIGNLLDDKNITRISDDSAFIDGSIDRLLFKGIKVNGIKSHIPIAKDKNAVELYVPRHRSLYDYIIHMPVHVHFISPDIIFLAGNNLFISTFDSLLRNAGGFMYLREDTFLKRKGLKKVFLSKDRYIDEVFSAYIRREMFEGVNENHDRMNLVIYPENEKDPVSKIRKGGRTKSGRLRTLSPLFFDKLKAIAKDYQVKLYVTAMNISFSKIPEAPYVVHPSNDAGIGGKVRYFKEQYFSMISYPHYAITHDDAKIEACINYGTPELLNPEDFKSVRDLLRFSKSLKDKIGLLESIFPVTFLYRVLDEDSELSLSVCKERMKILFDYYSSIGVDLEKISDSKGNVLPAMEIIEKSIKTINTNPSFSVKNIKISKFLEISSDRIISHDPALQAWYANNLRHLDSTHQSQE